MKHEYKLIACDMDGTILTGQNQLTDYTKAAIHQAISSGVHFIFATGRIFGSARIFTKELNLDAPLIACNGALIKQSQTGELLYKNPLDPVLCSQIFDIFEKDNQYFHFYGEEVFYTTQDQNDSKFFFVSNNNVAQEDRVPICQVSDTHQIPFEDPIYKIFFKCKDEEEKKHYHALFSSFPDLCVTSSRFDNIEITHKGANKGSALKYFASTLNIKQEEIICFGDNHNDISMFEYAGTGVAMGNAEQSVLDIATYVTATNNEDGVAKAIKKLIL